MTPSKQPEVSKQSTLQLPVVPVPDSVVVLFPPEPDPAVALAGVSSPPQATTPFIHNTGAIGPEKEPVTWKEFVWTSDQTIKDCVLHKISWRFYENGLICLEVCGSKDAVGLDGSDLIGHRLELRDDTGFLIGIWAAAFLIVKNTERRSFQTSTEDDHKLLKLHFGKLAEQQTGIAFRI